MNKVRLRATHLEVCLEDTNSGTRLLSMTHTEEILIVSLNS